MKYKFSSIIIFLLFLNYGCVTYTHAYKARKLLPRLQEGQTTNNVLGIMEHLPFKIENFAYKGNFYEVWFYNIQENYNDSEKLIPLVFENHKLIGWGEGYYKQCFKDR